MNKAKPYEISKRLVYDAYKQVKANGGADGIDRQSIEDFERDLKGNLYKVWNRMSSGSYFPPAVLGVKIPKSDGGERLLGIPTVADRIAQTVVKLTVEPTMEPYFHEDSYGYRPNKSATDAIGVARKRCWRYDWVIDLDIKGFFDHLDHNLAMKAVRKHVKESWAILYIERWLKAPMQQGESLINRDLGTPQGGVISPLLANLFLHYAFDEWMRRNHPNIPFERYADDVVLHCKSEKQAQFIKDRVAKRLMQCGLELHPRKTRIVYCQDDDRRQSYPINEFDFLGYTFRKRGCRTKAGKLFVGFSPAVSDKAKKEIRKTIRGWRIHLWSGATLRSIAKEINPVVRGWINYYGEYYRSELRFSLQQIDAYLIRWVKTKYKRLRGRQVKAARTVRQLSQQAPELFAHWKAGFAR
ncbi:MAG: group II intron reverse transcriptase/maturase [Gammaproteobacteria bacterium]|nr:group II intron reverse transcriptase/maturase [Gammaproteobacteria bacterium]MCB1860075.1 group II intron reverse transcriptase/maturase [Gammaproteobacteria bacterium]MCP5418841.1 group II intron reverse transcriptase/maturase [Chromatiaceae bacterium]